MTDKSILHVLLITMHSLPTKIEFLYMEAQQTKTKVAKI